jgi:hypothetical protein
MKQNQAKLNQVKLEITALQTEISALKAQF